jgi:hypothetical protein
MIAANEQTAKDMVRSASQQTRSFGGVLVLGLYPVQLRRQLLDVRFADHHYNLVVQQRGLGSQQSFRLRPTTNKTRDVNYAGRKGRKARTEVTATVGHD